MMYGNYRGNWRDRLNSFMYGRYGNDELSRFLSIVGIVFLFVSIFCLRRIFILLALIVTCLSLARTMSRNIYSRQIERNKYLNIRNKIVGIFSITKNRFRDRKTHRYYKCPNCKAIMRIKKPETRKKISIHCAKCGNNFEVRA